MARPTKNDIDSGIQNWDGKIDDNDEAIFNTPFPIHEHTGDESDLASTFTASAYDRCLVWVDHTTDGWVLYYSDGTTWEHFARPTHYTSAQTAIVAAALTSFTHGLGKRPDLIRYSLICITAEFGYSIGDEIELLTPQITRGSSKQAGMSVVFDDTTIDVRLGTDAFPLEMLDHSTGGSVNLTLLSWEYQINAYTF